MNKTKKFKEFINKMEIGLDLTSIDKKNEMMDLSRYDLVVSHDAESLKKAAENMGLDLTKNLSKRIDLI